MSACDALRRPSRGFTREGEMAYLKELVTECDAPGCSKAGRVELFNRWNTRIGAFCRACGKARLRKLEESETRDMGPIPLATGKRD